MMGLNKLKVLLLISISCWCLLTVIIIFLLVISNFMATDKPNMIGKNYEDVIEFRYNSSGDMIGSEIDILLKSEDGNLYITYFTRETHNDEGVTKKVKVPVSALDEINTLFHKCRIQELKKLKKSDIEELDGVTIDIEFITKENRYRIFSNNEIPPQAKDVIPESYEILMRYCED